MVKVTLPACNGETLPGPVLADNALQIRSVELPELSGTRALGATQLNEIGVYVTDNDHTALADAPYVYKLQNGTWSCDTPPSITVEESASDYLYAYSPSGLAVTNVLSGSHTVPVTVVADNFTASGQTDYLYGKSDPLTVNKNSRAVTFTMCHALAKVSFRVLKSNNVEETVTLKKIELLSSTARLQTGTSGVMNLKDGILNGLASTNSITLNGSVEAISARQRAEKQNSAGGSQNDPRRDDRYSRQRKYDNAYRRRINDRQKYHGDYQQSPGGVCPFRK